MVKRQPKSGEVEVTPVNHDEYAKVLEELRVLKLQNDELKRENETLRRRGQLDNGSWVDVGLTDIIDTMDEQFKRIGSHMADAVKPNLIVAPTPSSIRLDGDLMARLEALMRYKEKSSDTEFKSAVRLLIGGYFSDAKLQQELEDYVFTIDRDVIAVAIAARLSYKNADKGVEALVYAYCKAAVMNTNIVISNTDEMIDATKLKYSYNTKDQVDTRPVVQHDVNGPLANQLDHVYNKHYLDGRTIALLHALSHMDESISGQGLALYHVGTATRFAECSILYIDGTPYKPFRVMKEHAIFPILPNEHNGRVEAMLTIFGGWSPISLVRVYSTTNVPSGLITGPISHVVSSMLANTVLYSCDVGFSPFGMYIQAVGNTDQSSRTNINCCQASFGLAPHMNEWNVARYRSRLCQDQQRQNYKHKKHTQKDRLTRCDITYVQPLEHTE